MRQVSHSKQVEAFTLLINQRAEKIGQQTEMLHLKAVLITLVPLSHLF